MASLELITYSAPCLPASALADSVRHPEEVQLAGWVYGQSIDALYVASALTSNGPKGVSVIPKAVITARVHLVGYIPAETLTATVKPDRAREG